MQFLTWDEVREWLSGRSMLDEGGSPVLEGPGQESIRLDFADVPGYRHFTFARDLIEGLGEFDEALLWVTQHGTWSSSENLHLYYRLRESYGERTHLFDRPALIALAHERLDLLSFLHLGMLFGWDLWIVTNYDYGRLFVSHDEFVLVSGCAETLRALRESWSRSAR